MVLLKKKLVRKPILNPEEIALNFKEDKYENANGILELLIKLETSSGSFLIDCISSTTVIALKIIRDGDLDKSHQHKHADLLNAVEKYQQWIQERFNYITTKFIGLLHNANENVCVNALESLVVIIQNLSWKTKEFPLTLYKRVLLALLSPRVDCRKIIKTTLKEPLQYVDLAFITFKCLSKHVRTHNPELSSVHKGNLVALLLLLQVPPKSTNTTKQELFCSTRKTSKISKKKAKKLFKKKKAAKLLLKSQDSDEDVSDDNTINDDIDDHIVDDTTDDDTDRDNDSDEEVSIKKEDSDDKTLKKKKNGKRRYDDSDEEYDTAPKAKKDRRNRRAEAAAAAEEEEEFSANYEPDDPNMIALPDKKTLRTSKKKMLPDEAFPEEDIKRREVAAALAAAEKLQVEELQVEESDSDRDDEEYFGGLPRELRGPLFQYSYKASCGYLTKLWDRMMTYTLSDDQYKRCLVFLPDHVMDHHADPVVMTDFFINSYNRGGGISLMAMHGVFLLMTKHNLHYSDFFPKVYRLLEPTVFHARYKGRFFVLLSMFMRSSHLPEYIAAAFVKRLSVLCLEAPETCTLLLVKCINNILARFPGLRQMYDDETETVMKDDVYDLSELDLKHCGATDSTLSGVKTVAMLANEKLYKAALFMIKMTTIEEMDFSNNLETEYSELFYAVQHAEDIKKSSVTYTSAGPAFFNAMAVKPT